MNDYHVHTRLCRHATGEVDAYVRQAITAGLTGIAFTDHIPLPGNFDRDHRMRPYEMEKYQRWIDRARKDYPEIQILFGIEADYYQGLESYLEGFLGRFDFDLVIMSVHFVPSWPQGNWVFSYDLPDRTLAQVFSEYIDVLTAGIGTGLFDVVGHADIIKRPGESLLRTCPEQVRTLLKAIAGSGMALEINTSGLRKQAGEPYPALSWLPLIAEHAIPVTTGSDAHAPEQVGWRLEELRGPLMEAGITRLAGYRRRKRIHHHL